MIVEVIPGDAQVLTGSTLTRAFPGFYAETTFLENLADLVMENCNFTDSVRWPYLGHPSAR